MTEAALPPARLRSLAVSALLGADRAPGAASAADMLRLAGVEGARARAGRRAGSGADPLPPCEPEDRPSASVAQTATLVRLLTCADSSSLEEWAQLAQARGVRIPEAQLPPALDVWTKSAKRPECFRDVIGRRGEWLARLNPAWAGLLSGVVDLTDAEERWQLGTPAERGAILARVRRADPARALAMVESTWKADGASERRRFLDVLREGLSIADEEFLERALDDRSAAVRAGAASLLADVPGSRLAGRMRERVMAMIRLAPINKGPTRRRTFALSVESPAAFDPAWARDSIVEKPLVQGIGERAWWMRQVVALADPAVLTPDDGPSPEEFLELVGESDYANELGPALVEAAGARGTEAWREAAALWALGRDHAATLPARLWLPLPPARQEALLTRLAADAALKPARRLAILSTCRHRLSEAFTRFVAHVAVEAMDKAGRDAPYTAYPALDALSRLVEPLAALAVLEPHLAGLEGAKWSSIASAIERIRLRADMHKEFGT